MARFGVRSRSLVFAPSTVTLEKSGWSELITADGRKLIVVHDDGGGAVWPLGVDAWKRHACALAGRNLTREEWARFVTGRSYRATCGSAEADSRPSARPSCPRCGVARMARFGVRSGSLVFARSAEDPGNQAV
jgi:hypothetical protein